MITVVYLCDLEKCGDRCRYPTCKLTTDVRHAMNFEKQTFEGGEEYYVEKEKTVNDNQCVSETCGQDNSKGSR